jgi:hypothetical protein
MESRRMSGAVIVFLFLALVFFSLPAQGEVPKTISYQGYLANASGVPVDGTVTMVFTIFDVPSGGSPIWGETQLNVPVINGIYNVILGSVNAINLSFDSPYYLVISIDGEELLPRKAITSVGYAFRAYTVDVVPSHVHGGADITTGTVSESRIDAAIARTAALTAHTSSTNNPHATTATQVGAATAIHNHSGADIASGTVSEPRIDAAIARTAALLAHSSNTNNPHATTAAQVGAALAGHNHDTAYVNAAGDTMTGTLNISGGNLLLNSGGPDTWISTGGDNRLSLRTNTNATNSRAWIELWGNDATRAGELALAGTYIDMRHGSTDTSAGISGIRLNNDGNVGVGILDPRVKLDVNGQIQARNGYGETISLGGDAVGGDFEITIASPSHNFVSLWNASTASPANLGAGRIDVSDRVTKTFSGATFGITPIAYGRINPSSVDIMTNNFTVYRNCTENRYEITIAGETDLYHAVILVTFRYSSLSGVRIAQTDSYIGNLLIEVVDIWGTKQSLCGALQDHHYFDFVVFGR